MNKLLCDFYKAMEQNKKKMDAIFVFVYNGMKTYTSDDPHLEECYTEDEVLEIINSVIDLFQIIKTYDSELAFMTDCIKLKNTKMDVYVYTMAQILPGYNRRTLIPSICLFYGFYNINADSYISALGCNKKAIYDLLKQDLETFIPKTLFKRDFLNLKLDLKNKVIVKPLCESCCIDVACFDSINDAKCINHLEFLEKKYGDYMVQEYIEGDEIGITVCSLNNEFYALQPMQISFFGNKKHLTHDDSYFNNFDLTKVDVPDEILRLAEDICRKLEFKCVTRLDFRKSDESFFLFDISPNPTLSAFSSCNYAARASLDSDFRAIYRLLTFIAIQTTAPQHQISIENCNAQNV